MLSEFGAKNGLVDKSQMPYNCSHNCSESTSSGSEKCDKGSVRAGMPHVPEANGGRGGPAESSRGSAERLWRASEVHRTPFFSPPRTHSSSSHNDESPPVPTRPTAQKPPRPPRPPRKPSSGILVGGALLSPRIQRKRRAGMGALPPLGPGQATGKGKSKASSSPTEFTTLLALLLTVLFGVLVIFQGFHANVLDGLRTLAHRGQSSQAFDDPLATEHFLDTMAASSHMNLVLTKGKQRAGGRKSGPLLRAWRVGGETRGIINSGKRGFVVEDLTSNLTSLGGSEDPSLESMQSQLAVNSRAVTRGRGEAAI